MRDHTEYEDLLLNPSWKVKPCLAFIEGKGPMVLSCREHHKGTNKQYLHTPRQPNHILPSGKGDQLCHAVIKPRTIKPMRASKYSNIYQMHEQRGSFQGVDTCDVTDFGDFSFTSVLLDESESRSVKNRPDINSLLNHYEKDGYMGSFTVNGIRERAKTAGPTDDMLKKCVEGATYVGLEDSMSMQHDIGEDNCIQVVLDNVVSECPHVVDTKRNWIKSIIHCQKMDKGGYGAWFPSTPSYKCNDRDSRMVWLLSGMTLCVKELWCLTDKVDMYCSKWHGWLLTYLTKNCFPEIIFRGDASNPIRRDNVRTVGRLLGKWVLRKEQKCWILGS